MYIIINLYYKISHNKHVFQQFEKSRLINILITVTIAENTYILYDVALPQNLLIITFYHANIEHSRPRYTEVSTIFND